ncbi:Crp/Fnr family transcriptional regulator [Bacillus sp. Marseille-P3661]|uniref:Crp/Fnr family transcriptional regulator n=1 Tax=Bacillus sp. Marseille-P3661 TaxID=1936234 RepID=UPI000C84D49D|nr:Crp/Fnr family transcriptional regulator [Bacillus sp. Marseille-P3661]
MNLKDNFSFELKELLHSSINSMKLEKGAFLFQEGMPVTEMYIVKSGLIRISKISADGKELTISICSAGDIVNELTLYTNETNHLLNARVIESAEVTIVKKEFLEEQLKHNNVVAFEYMKWMSNHLRKTQTKFRDLVLYGKKGALFSTIIRMTNKYGVTKDNGDIAINLPLTDQELALFCGTSRETVNRLLSDLRDDGILSKNHDKIIVHDLNYMREEISCENCSVEVCSL